MKHSEMIKNLQKIHQNGRFAFIIPVYNHAGSIVEVIRQALKFKCPVFVIDDGSTDTTYERIKDIAGIRIICHKKNMGKGAAIMSGFIAASAVADWAITIDADGQHYPEDALNMIEAISEGERPIVVGAREGMVGDDVPWTSRFGRKFSNFWVSLSGGPVISDSQSGMRLYPLPEAIELHTQARRFQFEVEILVHAKRKGIPVIEAPVRVVYSPDGSRISHFRPLVEFSSQHCYFFPFDFYKNIFLFAKKCIRPEKTNLNFVILMEENANGA